MEGNGPSTRSDQPRIRKVLMFKNILLATALGLIISALSAQTGYAQSVATKPASIPISSLPFDISAPGNYVLTGNLSTDAPGCIIIHTPLINGTVTVDLKGFTINGFGGHDSFG